MVEQLPPSIMLMVQPHEATSTRIHFGGSDEQRERFLPDLIAGRKIAATGSTEPGHGSDPRGIKTTATPDGTDHVVLRGRKQWISNAPVCDLIYVTCRMPNPDGGFRMARVLVDRSETPFETRELEMHGLCQAPLGEVLFDNCRVPLRNVCPDSADTARLLTITWLVIRPAVGLMAVGLAQRALDMAPRVRRHAQAVRQGDRCVPVHPDRPGRHRDAGRDGAADLLPRPGRDRPRRTGQRAVGAGPSAMRSMPATRPSPLRCACNGAMGLSRELGLEQLARDVRTLSIPDGTPGILALIQGRELTGIDPFR